MKIYNVVIENRPFDEEATVTVRPFFSYKDAEAFLQKCHDKTVKDIITENPREKERLKGAKPDKETGSYFLYVDEEFDESGEIRECDMDPSIDEPNAKSAKAAVETMIEKINIMATTLQSIYINGKQAAVSAKYKEALAAIQNNLEIVTAETNNITVVKEK